MLNYRVGACKAASFILIRHRVRSPGGNSLPARRPNQDAAFESGNARAVHHSHVDECFAGRWAGPTVSAMRLLFLQAHLGAAADSAVLAIAELTCCDMV